MKIVFTGGGTGGHFYPIIAVAEAIHKVADREKILDLKLYYYSDSPYDKEALFEQGIIYREIPAGKRRLYSSFANFLDLFKTGYGVLVAIGSLFFLYPDVVFSKGGYASFPVTFAARILGIPVVIHESDSIPGRANLWAGKFAKRIAVSYEEAAASFPKDRVAVTGQPIREIIREKKLDGAFEYLKLDSAIPVIVVVGGSLGAEAINDAIIAALPKLVEKYQIVHQTGTANFKNVKARAEFTLASNPHKARYAPFPFLNPLAVKMSAGAASLIISRAGSTIFEIAGWGLPSIIIPIPSTISRDQMSNAFSYARHGAATVIEQENLSEAVLLEEIDRFFTDIPRRDHMIKAAKAFASPDAAEKIAKEVVSLAVSHEA